VTGLSEGNRGTSNAEDGGRQNRPPASVSSPPPTSSSNREGVQTVGNRTHHQSTRGCANASLYHTFGSKEELVLAYLERPARPPSPRT